MGERGFSIRGGNMSSHRISLQDKCKQFAINPKAVRAMLLSARQDIVNSEKEMEVEEFGIFSFKDQALTHKQYELDFYQIEARRVMKIRHRPRDRSLKLIMRAVGSNVDFSFQNQDFRFDWNLSYSAGLVATYDSRLPAPHIVTAPMQQQRIGRTLAGVPRLFSQFTQGSTRQTFIHVDEKTGRFYRGNGIDFSVIDPGSMTVTSMDVVSEDSGLPITFQFFPPNASDGDPAMHSYAKAFLAILRFMMTRRANGPNTGPLWLPDFT
jgi:hypothetical protein